MHILLGILAIAAGLGLTDADIAAALKGEIPVRSETFTSDAGKSAGRGIGAIVVERSVDDVWTTLSRYEDKADYIPRLKSVEVVEKQPDRVRARMVVDASVTTARYTGIYELHEKERIIQWKLDKTAAGNTIADMEGDYHVFELSPSRTLVVYRTSVDSGRSVPKFVSDFMTKKSIPNLLKAVKQRVESGGTFKK